MRVVLGLPASCTWKYRWLLRPFAFPTYHPAFTESYADTYPCITILFSWLFVCLVWGGCFCFLERDDNVNCTDNTFFKKEKKANLLSMADFSPCDDAIAENSCNWFFYMCTRTVTVSFIQLERIKYQIVLDRTWWKAFDGFCPCSDHFHEIVYSGGVNTILSQLLITETKGSH